MPMTLGITLDLSQSGTGVPHAGSNLLLADGASFFLLANGSDVLLLAV